MNNSKFLAMAMVALTVTGCTSYAGISQADKSDSYYIVTNTSYAGFNTPGIRLCDAKSGNNELACREVKVIQKN